MSKDQLIKISEIVTKYINTQPQILDKFVSRGELGICLTRSFEKESTYFIKFEMIKELSDFLNTTDITVSLSHTHVDLIIRGMKL